MDPGSRRSGSDIRSTASFRSLEKLLNGRRRVFIIAPLLLVVERNRSWCTVPGGRVVRMNVRGGALMFVAIVSASFAIATQVIEVAFAADCTDVGVACPVWGATKPLVPGWCCVAQVDNGAVSCANSGAVKGVTMATNQCGKLAPITNGECGSIVSDPCGIFGGIAGCTSKSCPPPRS